MRVLSQSPYHPSDIDFSTSNLFEHITPFSLSSNLRKSHRLLYEVPNGNESVPDLKDTERYRELV